MTIYCTRLVVYYFLHIKYTLPPKIHSPVWSKTTRICNCVGGAGADPLLLPKKEVVSYAIGSKCVISNIRQLVSDEMFVENQHTKSQKREVPPPYPSYIPGVAVKSLLILKAICSELVAI